MIPQGLVGGHPRVGGKDGKFSVGTFAILAVVGPDVGGLMGYRTGPFRKDSGTWHFVTCDKSLFWSPYLVTAVEKAVADGGFWSCTYLGS